MSSLPYRPNVCMLLRNAERKLLLGERHGESGIWQFPQGGVEDGASLEETVIRELFEELGIECSLLSIVRKLRTTNQYDFARPPAYAIGKFRGQSQTYWLVDFLGCDHDIKLDRSTPEFQNWRWCSRQEIEAFAEPRRLGAYRRALDELGSEIT